MAEKEKDVGKEEDIVKEDAQPYARASHRLKFREIIFNNFVGGLSWAMGATIGLSLIVTILTLMIKNVNINLIPVVGTFASQVIDFVISHNPNLQK